MKKIMLIKNDNISFLGDIKGQIEYFLKDFVEYKEARLTDLDVGEDVDMYLVVTQRDYIDLTKMIEDNNKIHIVRLTLLKKDLDVLRNLETNTEIYLVERSLKAAEEMMGHIWRYNFLFNTMLATPDDVGKCKNLCIISENIANESGLPEDRTLVIGGLLIEYNSMVDLGMKLSLDKEMRNRELERDFIETQTYDKVFERFITEALMYMMGFNVLVNMNEFAIIGVDSKGIVNVYNEKARKIFNIDMHLAVGKDVNNLFGELEFDKVLGRNDVIRDEIIKIDGEDIIYSIEPLDELDTRYGAVAIARKFKDEERKQRNLRARISEKGHSAKYNIMDIVGESEAAEKMRNDAYKMSQSDSSVLITGESGTGKELLAQSIHQLSYRRDKPFVAMNCGALPESILESELFGYEEGAFSGARRGGKIGLFEMANKGTLFLDEIGEMPLRLQLRFLRVIQEREFMKLGSDSVIKIDIRIIAATNRDLFSEVRDGRFRSDLFYRLNVLPLNAPPLRKRREDIFVLMRHFMKKFECTLTLTDDAKEDLYHYDWPGNIRELRNMVEYLKNMGRKYVDVDDLPKRYMVEEVKDSSEEVDKNSGLINFLKGDKIDIMKTGNLLRVLIEASNEGKRLGRRTIHNKLLENGVEMSEHDIRRLLMLLDMNEAVVIGRGRAATLINEKGERIYRHIKNKYET